jgi:hypothetical protein
MRVQQGRAGQEEEEEDWYSGSEGEELEVLFLYC